MLEDIGLINGILHGGISTEDKLTSTGADVQKSISAIR